MSCYLVQWFFVDFFTDSFLWLSSAAGSIQKYMVIGC